MTTPPTTATSSTATTTAPMTIFLRSLARRRAAATARLPPPVVCACRFLRALRSAPPTGQVLPCVSTVSSREPRMVSQPSSDARLRGRTSSQPASSRKPRSRAISCGYCVSPAATCAAAAEAAAVDRQPAGPGLGDRPDEREQHQRRAAAATAGAQPDQEQHAERELEERERAGDHAGHPAGQQVVGLHGDVGLVEVARLDAPDTSHTAARPSLASRPITSSTRADGRTTTGTLPKPP